MRKLYLVIAFALSIGFSLPAFSQVLWQSAETGMSIAQVKNSFPNAVRPEKVDTYSDTVTHLEGLLHIPNYKIGTQDFNVQFLFDESDKLDSVMMNQVGSYPSVGFDSIKKLLSIKYGEPINIARSSYAQTFTWMDKGVNIELIYSPSYYLKVRYTESDSVEANKL